MAEQRTAQCRDLAEALRLLIRLSGRTISAAQLLSGLPVSEGELPLDLLPRAAARAGFTARILERPISQLSAALLPAIVLTRDGTALVVTGIDADGACAEVAIPEAGGGLARLTLSELEALHGGKVILARPDRETAAAYGTAHFSGHWFWSAVRPLRNAYMQVALASVFVNVLALASPLFIMNVYDRVLPNNALTTLWVLTAGVVLALVFDLALRNLRAGLIGHAGRRADVLLAGRVFAKVLDIDLKNRPLRTGEFANQLREFEAMREFFTSLTLATIADILFISVFIAVVAVIGGVLALVPLAGVVLAIAIAAAVQLPLRSAVRRDQQNGVRRYSLLFETISGIESIKAAGAQGSVQRNWERAVTLSSETTERLRNIAAQAQHATALVQQLITIGVVLLGAYLFQEGLLSTGAIIAAVMLSNRAVAPLGALVSMATRAQQALLAYRGIDAIMRLEEEAPADKSFADRSIEAGRISFKDVTFSYPASPRPSLERVTFSIAPGERVGIIGRIGSGKTTIGRLMSRLFRPSNGEIIIDGLDIAQYHPGEVRRRISFASQDATIFHGTVRDNIILGHPHVTDERVIEVAEISGVMDFVRSHPDGLDRQVGESGRNLSSGQRQALILARALITDPAVVFLDEPTGSLDTQSEATLVRKLEAALRPDQTLVLTTHRSAALALADRLIVLDKGRVIADGPKAEVLAALTGNRLPREHSVHIPGTPKAQIKAARARMEQRATARPAAAVPVLDTR